MKKKTISLQDVKTRKWKASRHSLNEKWKMSPRVRCLIVDPRWPLLRSRSLNQKISKRKGVVGHVVVTARRRPFNNLSWYPRKVTSINADPLSSHQHAYARLSRLNNMVFQRRRINPQKKPHWMSCIGCVEVYYICQKCATWGKTTTSSTGTRPIKRKYKAPNPAPISFYAIWGKSIKS